MLPNPYISAPEPKTQHKYSPKASHNGKAQNRKIIIIVMIVFCFYELVLVAENRTESERERGGGERDYSK